MIQPSSPVSATPVPPIPTWDGSGLPIPGHGGRPRPHLPLVPVAPLPSWWALAAGDDETLPDGCPDDSAEDPCGWILSVSEDPLSAATSRLAQMLGRTGSALDSALWAIASPLTLGTSLSPAQHAIPPGGSFDAPREDETAATPVARKLDAETPALAAYRHAAATDPYMEMPLALPEERPPLEPEAVPSEILERLPAPPIPKELARELARALETPWTPAEGLRYREEVPRTVEPSALADASRRLHEIEQFVGGEVRAVHEKVYAGPLEVTNRGGFQQLVQETHGGLATATGVYAVRFVEMYQAYKIDFYTLARARRRQLDRLDPSRWDELVAEEEIEEWLWRRYGRRLRALLWRLVRCASPRELDRLPHGAGRRDRFGRVLRGLESEG